MRRHLTNAAYGVLDYASYPLGMLLVAPIVLHKLGAAEYGLWSISTATISAGGILASGFCDANIQRVARLRGSKDSASMLHTVRSMLGINLVFGSVLGLIAWFAAPFAARHIAVSHPAQFHDCLMCMRIASILILIRAIESVTVSTQRAFEQFAFSVKVNTAVRLLTLGSAALLAWFGLSMVSILAETACFLAAGTFLQFQEARRILGAATLWPAFHPGETRILLNRGVFSWIQAVGGVIFSQFDRLLLGLSLGSLAVAPYTLCVQFTQPIYGLTASGLQFLFPYLSGRVGTVSPDELKRILLKAFACNLLLVVAGAGTLLTFGDRLIRLWAGPAVAHSAAAILPPIVLGSALMGLSVTGTYAMLALGLFRTVALISISARGLMLLMMTYLIHHNGIQGLAFSRTFYGLFALIVYVSIVRRLEADRRAAEGTPAASQMCKLREVSEP